MTAGQRIRRDRIDRRFPADPKGVQNSFTKLISQADRLWRRMPMSARGLRSDEHRTYPIVLRRSGLRGVRHMTVSSPVARTPENPLFTVNYLDREIRKDLAEHHRETVCFARSAAVSTARRRMHTERAFLARALLDHVMRQVWAAMIPTPERENRTSRRPTPRYCLC